MSFSVIDMRDTSRENQWRENEAERERERLVYFAGFIVLLVGNEFTAIRIVYEI